MPRSGKETLRGRAGRWRENIYICARIYSSWRTKRSAGVQSAAKDMVESGLKQSSPVISATHYLITDADDSPHQPDIQLRVRVKDEHATNAAGSLASATWRGLSSKSIFFDMDLGMSATCQS